jgi:hypothetical protein
MQPNVSLRIIGDGISLMNSTGGRPIGITTSGTGGFELVAAGGSIVINNSANRCE